MSYITFSTLGESGGMCSQLQSYASLLAVAKANNKEIVFAKSMFDKGCGIKIFDELKYFMASSLSLLFWEIIAER